MKAKEAITDTGTSCIFGPKSEVNSIRHTILNMIEGVFEDVQWDYLFECSKAIDLPKFSLLFGGYWMEVLPEDYIVPITTNGKFCAVCLKTR